MTRVAEGVARRGLVRTRVMRRVLAGVAALGVAVGTVVPAAPAYAADGDLDSTFGVSGLAPLGMMAAKVLLQPDGKIVTVGMTYGVSQPPTPPAIVAVRMLADGSPDVSFGDGVSGRAVKEFDPIGLYPVQVGDGAIQPDGKILVAGNVMGAGPSNLYYERPTVVRFTKDGLLDPTFGVGGVAQLPLDGAAGKGGIGHLGVQSDGRIVLGGAFGPVSGVLDSFLIRLQSDGSLDASFGAGGFSSTKVGGNQSSIGDMEIQSDDRIVLVGEGRTAPTSPGQSFVSRFTSNGQVDADFGEGGFRALNLGLKLRAGSLALQPDGKLLIGAVLDNGWADNSGVVPTLARVTTNGDMDLSFGIAGIASASSAGAVAFLSDVAVLPDGKIIAGGVTGLKISPTFEGDPLFLRFNADGSLDTGFGQDGRRILSGPSYGLSTGVVARADGDVVALLAGGRYVPDRLALIKGSIPPPVVVPPVVVPPVPAPVVGGEHVGRSERLGYRLIAADGGLFAFGGSRFFGSAGATAGVNVVGAAVTPTDAGYRLVASDGRVFAFGDATHLGSPVAVNKPIVGMASTASGNGYWLVASDGGIFAYGDAVFYGSTGATKLNKPIVGMASTASGNGYWLVASDGGIFAYGDAVFYGSTGATKLNKPIVGMASTASGNGYWLVASDGGIFAYGDAAFYGSTGATKLNKPIVGMASTASGNGYWLVASDGGIFAYGDAVFYGSTGATKLNKPIVAMS